MTNIAIVNEKDIIIGAAEKAKVRKRGDIHRVVRILIFNKQGQLLLQKRSAHLQDSPNKWDF